MPIVTMIAGPNGSGKSTLTEKLKQQGLEFGSYFNADDIAKSLSGSPHDVTRLAQIAVREKRLGALENGDDHCFETVMSHPSHIEYLLTAREHGFETRLVFVCTQEPSINVGRVTNRVLHGGHAVPQDRIIARYARCLENLPLAIAASDYCLIFDNSSVMRPFRPLAEIRNGYLRHLSIDQFTIETFCRGWKVFPNEAPYWWLTTLQKIMTNSAWQDGPIL